MIKSYIVLFQTISILPPIEGIGISWGAGGLARPRNLKNTTFVCESVQCLSHFVTECLYPIVHGSSRKYPYSPGHRRDWNFLGAGGSVRPKNIKKCTKLNWISRGVGEGIFSITTLCSNTFANDFLQNFIFSFLFSFFLFCRKVIVLFIPQPGRTLPRQPSFCFRRITSPILKLQ